MTGRARVARDVLAGLTVALVLIPQSLAYADIAGMPPEAGLYAATLPVIAASLVASSPYLQTGPVATTSLLTAGALAGLAPVGSPEYLELGLLLAVLIGVARVLLGLARAAWVAHLMSEPMLMGFLPAAAILIIASQVPAGFGASADGRVTTAALSTLADPAAWDLAVVALLVATIAVSLTGRLRRRFPAVLVALVAGVAAGGMLGDRVPTLEDVPAGFPPIDFALPVSDAPSLLLPAFVIAFVGFAEAASTARVYATYERQRWSASREFVGQGVANLVAGFSGGQPVGGSISRTALNYDSGAVSRLSGAVTGVFVLAFVPFAAVLEPLPEAVLAGVVVAAVLGLLRFGRLVALWRISRPQFLVAWTTFALTIALAPHVEWAVLSGIALSLAVHLVRELRLHLAATLRGDVLEVRPAGVLWFATAYTMHEGLIRLLAQHPHVTRLEVHLDRLGRIDLTGVMTLGRALEEVRAAGVEVEIVAVPAQSRGLIARYNAYCVPDTGSSIRIPRPRQMRSS